MLVLIARQGVQVEDGVQVVPRARLDGPVQVLESRLLQHERLQVVLEVPVVER
jgi:hypothetical protein